MLDKVCHKKALPVSPSLSEAATLAPAVKSTRTASLLPKKKKYYKFEYSDIGIIKIQTANQTVQPIF